MKRFHVHVHVADLDHNIAFYSRLFGAQPSVQKPDYAKWMLDDPRLNFAISSGRPGAAGIAHLGLQAEQAEELAEIGERLKAADAIALTETETTCCYARSDKFWAVDPQGVQWESFHTLGDATAYYADTDESTAGEATAGPDPCCGPGRNSGMINAAACCGDGAQPVQPADSGARCCG